jgi:hypothetical protein
MGRVIRFILDRGGTKAKGVGIVVEEGAGEAEVVAFET